MQIKIKNKQSEYFLYKISQQMLMYELFDLILPNLQGKSNEIECQKSYDIKSNSNAQMEQPTQSAGG